MTGNQTQLDPYRHEMLEKSNTHTCLPLWKILAPVNESPSPFSYIYHIWGIKLKKAFVMSFMITSVGYSSFVLTQFKVNRRSWVALPVTSQLIDGMHCIFFYLLTMFYFNLCLNNFITYLLVIYETGNFCYSFCMLHCIFNTIVIILCLCNID